MALTNSLRHRQGLADIRGAGNLASAPGGTQTTRMGYPASSAVTSPADAGRFVADRVVEGADYIKVIVEDPRIMGAAALDGTTIAALVEAAHQAGVTILAGTDSYQGPAAPASIKHGEAFHDELGLLVEAGLTSVEALRSATVVPAAFFGFTDREVIAAGRRADLLLIDGDPTQDIAATRAIRGVWVAGVQVR